MYTLAAYAVYLVYVVTVMFFSPIDVGQVGQIAALHFQSLLMVSVPSKITQGPECLKNRFYSQVIQPKQHTKSAVWGQCDDLNGKRKVEESHDCSMLKTVLKSSNLYFDTLS